jgi:hypothetical protein
MGAPTKTLLKNIIFQRQRCKDAMIKDLKLEILICFNSPINEH